MGRREEHGRTCYLNKYLTICYIFEVHRWHYGNAREKMPPPGNAIYVFMFPWVLPELRLDGHWGTGQE